MKEHEHPNPFFRVDLLTGSDNLVSFSKALDNNFENAMLESVSLIITDLYQLRDINKARGFEYGDSLLRWLGIAIKDEIDTTVYRISGDNFVAVLTGNPHTHQTLARNLFDRLNSEANQLELVLPVVRMAVIQFPEGQRLNPAVVWRNINEKMELTHAGEPFMIFEANTAETDTATLHAIELMAKRIETLGGTLQYTFRLAYTDPVSNAPNMLAIQRKLELTLGEALLDNKPLSLCLIDGDSLKRYNSHGYAAGDDVIRKLTSTLTAALRPSDFLGRWRMGDEFIVILPATTADQASLVAERLRAAVEQASHAWLFPTSISIGVSYFPKHGYTADQLVEAAEKALTRAKLAGKNRVIVAE